MGGLCPWLLPGRVRCSGWLHRFPCLSYFLLPLGSSFWNCLFSLENDLAQQGSPPHGLKATKNSCSDLSYWVPEVSLQMRNEITPGSNRRSGRLKTAVQVPSFWLEFSPHWVFRWREGKVLLCAPEEAQDWNLSQGSHSLEELAHPVPTRGVGPCLIVLLLMASWTGGVDWYEWRCREKGISPQCVLWTYSSLVGFNTDCLTVRPLSSSIILWTTRSRESVRLCELWYVPWFPLSWDWFLRRHYFKVSRIR